MDKFALTAEPFLGGFSRTFAAVELVEIVDVSIVSFAVPIDGLATFKKAIKSALDAQIPAPGTADFISDGTYFLRTSSDQFLALLQNATKPADVINDVGTNGYCTDQSDNWVTLRIKGPMARSALERICPIDIDPQKFAKGAFARTTMEHLGAIILSEGDNSFLLLSASSSAGSFLHAIETSIKNIS